MTFDFEITTPERVAFKAKARQVTLPTVEGEITVLPGHVPLIAPMAAGELRIVDESGKDTLMAVAGGFVTVGPKSLTVLADSAERAEELDLKAIEAAYSHAEELMKEAHDDKTRLADARAVFAREFARLGVARKHHTRHKSVSTEGLQ